MSTWTTKIGDWVLCQLNDKSEPFIGEVSQVFGFPVRYRLKHTARLPVTIVFIDEIIEVRPPLTPPEAG